MVVENFRPDVKTRLGIDYETLQQAQPAPRLRQHLRLRPDGPYRDRPGYDQIAQGMGGLMSITGLPGQGPVRVGIPVADLTAGIFLAQGILVALLERERSGKGQWVHTSLLEAMVTMLDFQAARWLIGERDPAAGRQRSPHRASPPASSRPRTATSTSPPPGSTCSAASARRSATEPLLDDPRFKYRAGPLQEPQGAGGGAGEGLRARAPARTGSSSSTPRACRPAPSST